MGMILPASLVHSMRLDRSSKILSRGLGSFQRFYVSLAIGASVPDPLPPEVAMDNASSSKGIISIFSYSIFSRRLFLGSC
jgi:hypothetical protein